MDRKNKKLYFWYALFWIFVFVALYLGYGVYFIDITSTKSKWLGLFASAVSILLFASKVLEVSYSKDRNEIIAKYEKMFLKGGFSFIKNQSKILIPFYLLICCFLFKIVQLPFIICSLVALILGYFLIISIVFLLSKIYSKNLSKNQEYIKNSRKISFMLSKGIAFLTIGLCFGTIVVLYHIFKDYEALYGFLLGFSLISAFFTLNYSFIKTSLKNTNVAFSKMFDVITFEDKRNPIVFSNQIIKNFFEPVIFSLWFFEIFSIILICSISLGALTLNLMGAFLPIILFSNMVFVSIFLSLLPKKVKDLKNPSKRLYFLSFLATGLLILASYIVVRIWFLDSIEVCYPVIIGLICGFLGLFINSNLTSRKAKSSKIIINSLNINNLNFILQGIKESFKSVLAPVLNIALGLTFSFVLIDGIEAPMLGVWGMLLFGIGFSSLFLIFMPLNIYSILNKNISNLIRANQDEKPLILKEKISSLLLKGQTYVVSSIIVAIITIIIAYCNVIELEEVDLLNPYVMTSILIGVAFPFLFLGYCCGTVSKLTSNFLFEIKKQFEFNPKILSNEIKPNYILSLKLCTKKSSSYILKIIIPIICVLFLIVFCFKTEALAGFIIGNLLSSIGLMFIISNIYSIFEGAKNRLKHFNLDLDDFKIESCENILSLLKNLIIPTISVLIKLFAVLALSLIPLFRIFTMI